MLVLAGASATGALTPAYAQGVRTPAAASLAVPSPEGLLLLIRTTTIAIDQANKTNNYAVLRQLGGPGLRAYSTVQLAQTFEPLRTNKVDLAPAAVATPELTERPELSPDSLLTLEGAFPTKPLQIGFKFVYQADHGEWKPFGLSVRLVSAPLASQPHQR
jgi:hypothetical protein